MQSVEISMPLLIAKHMFPEIRIILLKKRYSVVSYSHLICTVSTQLFNSVVQSSSSQKSLVLGQSLYICNLVMRAVLVRYFDHSSSGTNFDNDKDIPLECLFVIQFYLQHPHAFQIFLIHWTGKIFLRFLFFMQTSGF